MKLNVLKDPWYSQGLSFTCTQCGNCCTGGPGFVWISDEEIGRLAEYLQLPRTEVVDQYCRKISGRLSLKESKNSRHGGFDCIFLKEDGSRRNCSIYPVRPLQCRTWPFWPEVLRTPQSWSYARRNCPGMNNGKHYPLEKIEALRDSQDWPANPPTSESSATDPV